MEVESEIVMTKITWTTNSTNPKNPQQLATIQDWLTSLNGKEVTLAQRLIGENGNASDLNWEPQRFDEKFVIEKPQIRGITVFWYKQNSDVERNLTPEKLELDPQTQKLYIYPQSQKQVVVRIGLATVEFETIDLQDPLIVGTAAGEKRIILLRDKQQQIDVKLTLSPENISKLIEICQGNLNSQSIDLEK
ncbi:MAG: hypothetical protein SAJ37_00935 [Oscillatoria sp. PMC 1068.18]|nr:hypothetical protein [Oscillatoria sp. PMC 1076.18]MEC4987286.1 hypothetical protein [Oscillatoria sp. PMC 1068.18]